MITCNGHVAGGARRLAAPRDHPVLLSPRNPGQRETRYPPETPAPSPPEKPRALPWALARAPFQGLGDWAGTGNGIGRQWSPEGAAQPEPRATPWECEALARAPFQGLGDWVGAGNGIGRQYEPRRGGPARAQGNALGMRGEKSYPMSTCQGHVADGARRLAASRDHPVLSSPRNPGQRETRYPPETPGVTPPRKTQGVALGSG
jgi:hypothetical protein